MTLVKLPVIEFNKENMARGSKGRESTMLAVRSALEEHGCFEAVYSEIEAEANEDLFRTIGDLFGLDMETKRRVTSDVPFEGYSVREDPFHERIATPNPLALQTIENIVRVLYPQGNKQICETLYSYGTKIKELENTVRRMVYESYGAEDYFEEQEGSMKYSLHLMKYVAGATNGSRGKEMNPHYDKNLVTILHEHGASGLQVKEKDGNRWTRPRLSGSSFLVLAGELLFGWSNGRVHCPLHRVTMRLENEEAFVGVRYSVGLFSTQDGTVRIPNEVVDEKHPLLFKPIDVPGLLQILNAEMAIPQDYYNCDNLIPGVQAHYHI